MSNEPTSSDLQQQSATRTARRRRRFSSNADESRSESRSHADDSAAHSQQQPVDDTPAPGTADSNPSSSSTEIRRLTSTSEAAAASSSDPYGAFLSSPDWTRPPPASSVSAPASAEMPRHYPASADYHPSSGRQSRIISPSLPMSGSNAEEYESELPEPPRSVSPASLAAAAAAIDVHSHSLLSQSYGRERFFDFAAPSASSPPRRRRDEGGFAVGGGVGGVRGAGIGGVSIPVGGAGGLGTLLPPRNPSPAFSPALNPQQPPPIAAAAPSSRDTPTQPAGADTYHSHSHSHSGHGGHHIPSSSGSATPLTSNLALLLEGSGASGANTAAAAAAAAASTEASTDGMEGKDAEDNAMDGDGDGALVMPSLGCTPSCETPAIDNTTGGDGRDDEKVEPPVSASTMPMHHHHQQQIPIPPPLLGGSAPGRFLLPPGVRLAAPGDVVRNAHGVVAGSTSLAYARPHHQRPNLINRPPAERSVSNTLVEDRQRFGGVGSTVDAPNAHSPRRSSTTDIPEHHPGPLWLNQTAELSQQRPSSSGSARRSARDILANSNNHFGGPRSADAALLFDDPVRRCKSVYDMRQNPSSSTAQALLSSSPFYTDMLHRKHAIEATLQQRLAQRRETSMKELLQAQNQMERRLSPRALSDDNMDQSQRSDSLARRLTNETRKCRRAEHNEAIITDLCEIVADLFVAELRLLNPTADSKNRSGGGIAILDGQTPDRESVLSTVAGFLSDLPMRYALSVDSPSEVLVHMRLMTSARADPTRAAVHIGNVDDGDNHIAVGSARPGTKLRLVTICCADSDGLLEYITKLLGTGGARVVDADVMLTSDSIVLDRFVVEMKGRLRLDKLQQYIESYLNQSNSKDDDKTQKDDIREENKEQDKSRPPPKTSESAPVLPSLSSRDKFRARPRSSSGSAYGPLYFHPPKQHRDDPQMLQQEIRSAVPLSTLVSSGSQTSPRPNILSQQRPGGRVFRQQQADPLLNLARPSSRYGRGSSSGTTSSSPPNGQATGEQSSSESPPSPPVSPLRVRLRSQSDAGAERRQRQMLVNREAMAFTSSPEHANGTLPEEDVPGRASSRPSGVAMALASQNRSRRVVPIIPFDELMLIETLGTGRISTVYRAAWQMAFPPSPMGRPDSSVTMVALKVSTVDADSADTSCIEELRREADIAAMLDHQNICTLVGVATDPECYCLAYEFCEGGSLLSLLLDPSRCYEYLPIALDIANGMAYLHSRNVIHRDLKPSNVLLTRDNRAKIADFGMSVAMTGQELTAETGTYRWMAPEVIRHESYSSNADVYSFGIVLWQLITREVPFATMTPVQTAYAVAEGHRPEIPESTPDDLRRIIEACWDEDSQKRPSFTYIAMALADYAKMAFNPANVGAQTVRIANEMLANVQGNSTVNVDFSTPVSIGIEHRRHSSLGMVSRADSSPGGRGHWFGPSSYSSGGTGGGNIGLEI